MHKKLFVLLFIFSSIVANSQLAAEPNTDNNEIAFASDTQAPMWVETLWLKKHNNKFATNQVFNSISARKPVSLFLLGDVVSLGSSNKQWKPMDNYLENLRNQGISVHAVLGNHEVMGRAKKGQKKFQHRFPDHVRTGYVEVKDSVAVVLLNSNFKKLSKQEDEAQVLWYKQTLAQLDANPAIQFIITACHHSPFTNSKVVGPSTSVQERFVQQYLKSPKSTLFLSGHCHGFEHYQVEGKDFFVIGGGGGLNQPLRKDGKVLQDLAHDYKPLFHYLTVRRQDGKLKVTSYQLNNDFTAFNEGKNHYIMNPNTFNSLAAKSVVTEEPLGN